MRYRRPPRPDRRNLYKGFHILPDDKGRYNIYDGCFELKDSAGTIREAWGKIDLICKQKGSRNHA